MSNSYSKILESYLIPANESADKDTKSGLIELGLLTAIFAALGISQHLKNRKREKDNNEKISNALKEKAQKSKEEWEKYKASPEYTQDCKYIANKYRINYPDDYDKKELKEKLLDSIESDLKKIANTINRNKKLCNTLAEEYIEYAKRIGNYEKYKESYNDEADEIRSGPACGNIFEDNFEISDISQGPRTWVCSRYLFSACCDGINEKYYREIKHGLMDKMTDTGDGDEGLISCGLEY